MQHQGYKIVTPLCIIILLIIFLIGLDRILNYNSSPTTSTAQLKVIIDDKTTKMECIDVKSN